MFDADQYELLDFGNGRKLERFAGVTINRPCPAARRFAPALPQPWAADLVFQRDGDSQGDWTGDDRVPAEWVLAHGAAHLLLKPTPAGQLGVFPEQAANWDWIAQRLIRQPDSAEQPWLLNLFAYTGGSTLAAAAAGAAVTHVDAARNVVDWARGNADQSGECDAPIRWIVEDAVKFAQREARRGKTYDAIVLDPPSYGHGPSGQQWRLERDLAGLLEVCGKLLSKSPRFVLLTCHTTGFEADQAADALSEAMPADVPRTIQCGEMSLAATDGRKLPSGVFARCVWPV